MTMTNGKPKRDTITALFIGFSGQENVLAIPRPFIDFCGGDHLAALLLSQILYWSDRTDDPEGWFAKSYDDWYEELCLTEYQIKRAVNGDKRRKNGGFSLARVGIETKLAQSKFYHGAATLHYRVDYAILTTAIKDHFSDPNNVQIEGSSDLNIVGIAIPTMFRSAPQQCSDRSTETITEIISETIDQELSAAPPHTIKAVIMWDEPIGPELPPKKLPTMQQLLFEALCKLFEYDMDKLTPTEKKKIGQVASELNTGGCKPENVKPFWEWIQALAVRDRWTNKPSMHSMKTQWSDYAKTLKPLKVLHVPVPQWRIDAGLEPGYEENVS